MGAGWSRLLPKGDRPKPGESTGLVKLGLGRRVLSAEGTMWAKLLRQEEVW